MIIFTKYSIVQLDTQVITDVFYSTVQLLLIQQLIYYYITIGRKLRCIHTYSTPQRCYWMEEIIRNILLLEVHTDCVDAQTEIGRS